MPEIRCKHKLHAEVSEEATGTLFKYCDSKFCKEFGNEVVIHEFDLAKVSENGIIYPTDTKRYKRPEVRGINK
ncbi:hypothetical protein SEA_LABELLE_29 [Mycobacterium phage Labelle]|nr:hypothetical protein SEA_LABELLE_29 [Mycobacterium phage Labelle]